MGYSTIVCGVTGSAHSQKAALDAALLAKKHNANLVFVYAVDVSFLQGGISMGLSHEYVENSLERVGGQILEMAGEIAKAQGVTPKMIVEKGPVLEVLKRVVSREKADLLVLGHENRTFFEKALFKGNVEDHVAELKQRTGVEVSVIT